MENLGKPCLLIGKTLPTYWENLAYLLGDSCLLIVLSSYISYTRFDIAVVQRFI